MPRKSTGTLYEKGGVWYVCVTVNKSGKRKTTALPAGTTTDQASARRDYMAEFVGKLRKAHQPDQHIETAIKQAAELPVDRLPGVRKVLDALCAGAEQNSATQRALRGAMTFKDFAEEWLRGDLHRRFPDHVRLKKTSDDDRFRLKTHIYGRTLAEIPIASITIEHAEDVMRQIPPARSAATRRHVAQLLHRVLNLAVYPAKLITHNPLPRGFLPRVGDNKAKLHLYPEEDAKLLGCKSVPIVHRLLYGVLAREGMRSSEATTLEWTDLDLKRGAVALDRNKTDDPRAWALRPDVAEALRRWKKIAPDHARIFVGVDGPLQGDMLAETFRDHLGDAKVTRKELFQRTENRRPIRIHDLRATFVTLSLAQGKSETWVADRTGHRSSQMINRYRRAARTAAELGVKALRPLDSAIPELRAPRRK